MKSFAEFKNHLDTNLSEDLKGLDDRRKAMESRKNWLGGILVSIITVNWAVTYMGYLPHYTILITIAIATPSIYFIYQLKFFDEKIPADFKDIVVKALVEFIDPSLAYHPEDYVPYEHFKNSKLFLLRPDRYYGDDYITGELEGIPVYFSELHVSLESAEPASKKKPKWSPIFDGFFVVAEVPFTLKGDVYILSDKLYKRFGYIGRLIHRHNFMRGKYIRPDNIDFRENFVVYADDLLEGELVLSEAFMKKMLKLRNHTSSKVYISLIDNKIYVAVNMKREIFKVNMHQPLYKTKYLKTFYNDLYLMLTLIEDLNFDAFLEKPNTPEAPEPEQSPFVPRE